MDAAERALLNASVGDAIAEAAPDGSTAVDAALAALGWHEMLRDEGNDAVDVVFRALGTTNASASVLDDVIVSALGDEPGTDRAVLLPPFAESQPSVTTDGERVGAVGLGTARVAVARELLVVRDAGGHVSLATVPMAGVDATAVGGVDPDAGLHTVRVDHDATFTTLDPHAWESAVALGRRALAHEIAGACRSMLNLACTHAVDRVQFGRPIARFQAVRHRLADALVTVEALDAALTAATDAPGPMTAALAKAVAGRTARTVGAHCQQVLAGIGFTTEHPFHRFLKRTMTLDGLLGSSDRITRDLGRELLDAGRVPTLIEL